MTKFQSSQIVSIALSTAFVLTSWLATVTTPVRFASAPVAAVELA